MTKLLALSVGDYNIGAPPQMPKDGLNTLLGAFNNLLTILLIIVIVLALFSIILSGIQWITSGGDEKGLEKARGRLKYSIIGLIVGLLSFFIIQFIANFFGVSTLINTTPKGKACIPKGQAGCENISDCCRGASSCQEITGAHGIKFCN